MNVSWVEGWNISSGVSRRGDKPSAWWWRKKVSSTWRFRASTPMIVVVLGFVTLTIAIGLAGALVFVIYRRGFLGSFWDALYPDFTTFNIGRGTTQTLRMLVVAMLVFGVVLALWAAGAGIMRAAWLYATAPDGGAPCRRRGRPRLPSPAGRRRG